MDKPIIHLNDIRFRWSGQKDDLLHIPQLTVEKGKHLFIQGPSGSGKTTLLNLLTGINKATSGTISILGSRLDQLSDMKRDQFRADHLGVIFQQFNLLPYLSLIDNVQLACHFSARKKNRAGDVRQTAAQLLTRLNLPSSMHDKQVGKLSVGQQQRAAVARALIGNPEIIIADEPTSALDNDNRDRFLQLLFQEAGEQDSTLIFVSHDQGIATQFKHVINLQTFNSHAKRVAII